MIIVCEDCGKKYQVDPSKIKGQEARTTCLVCGHIIRVAKPGHTLEDLSPEPPSAPPEPALQENSLTGKAPFGEDSVFEETSSTDTSVDVSPPEKSKQEKKVIKVAGKKRRIGLRTKIFILFFFIPILLIITAGVLYLDQLKRLSVLIGAEGRTIVTGMAEQIIQDKGRAVAAQVKLYIESHPYFEKEKFYGNKAFREIALQKIGETGYTTLHAVPDENGIWRNWVHTNPQLVGFDMSKLKETLGENFPDFWNIFSSGKSGRESMGYYTWQDKDGSFREKYMVCTPVKGTPFVIASTTYLDEFTQPMTHLEERASKMRAETEKIVLAILGATLLLIGLIVAVYGHKLTARITSLTDLTERISVGDLDAEINIDSRDELGDLAQAVSRMQDSIRLAIERLRRRR